MRTTVNSDNKLTMLAQMSNDSKFQVLEYDKLDGATDMETALGLNIMNDAGIKLKQVRIILQDSAVKLEAGALSYMKGDIDIRTKTGGVIGLGKKFFASKVTGEEMFKIDDPIIKSKTELEDEEIIVDDGMFYACEDGIEVGVTAQKTVSSLLLGNEGVFQVRLKGSGIVVLELPVPESEIFKCKLSNDTLKVDGNFVALRSGRIDFTVEKSSSVIGSVTNGEGLLNVYSGIGEIWILPTKSVYYDLKMLGLNRLTNTVGKSNTEV